MVNNSLSLQETQTEEESFDDDDSQLSNDNRRRTSRDRRSNNEDAFSSSSSDYTDNDEASDNDDDDDGGDSDSEYTDEYDDDEDEEDYDDDDEEDEEGAGKGRTADRNKKIRQNRSGGSSGGGGGSEFDKALRTGDTHSSAFLIKADLSLVDEIMEQQSSMSEQQQHLALPEGGGQKRQQQYQTNITVTTPKAVDASNTITSSSNSNAANRQQKVSAALQSAGPVIAKTSHQQQQGMVVPNVLESMKQSLESMQLLGGGGNSAGAAAATTTTPGAAKSADALHGHHPPIPPPPIEPNQHINDQLSSSKQRLTTATSNFQQQEDQQQQQSNNKSKSSNNNDNTNNNNKSDYTTTISAAVLVSLAHKRYERRRLAAMEIEKVVRQLVVHTEYERVRAILLLLSDDYVRSISEDARKGGVVALAACAIGLKKASNIINNKNASEDHTMSIGENNNNQGIITECKDLILASVIHACQDHSSRVRYYATESLFNVIKVIPSLAIDHFYILYEILRSLYADVDLDVRSGSELLDKKLKEIIINNINQGTYTIDNVIPIFGRFIYTKNKPTKVLTLTWLQELTDKVQISTSNKSNGNTDSKSNPTICPILEFIHLFLGGIFLMIADPNINIRQSALSFLQSILPKLLQQTTSSAAAKTETQKQDAGESYRGDHDSNLEQKQQNHETIRIDYDKIIQSLVTTMEHPDPFVRKVAMYWMSRIVKAHMNVTNSQHKPTPQTLSAATISVRNSLPHVLPGILLSIGDTFNSRAQSTTTRDSFLPDQSTRSLAEQTNECLQNAVRYDGKAYVSHLDGFIVALREELDSPGGLNTTRNNGAAAVERKPYRMDVKQDGSGIESTGWFRSASAGQNDTTSPADGVENIDSMMMSRLCALEWIIVLYESVVPDILKSQYAREFIAPIIHQLVENPPEVIIYKSLEVLAKITIPVAAEDIDTDNALATVVEGREGENRDTHHQRHSMIEKNAQYALGILEPNRRRLQSRDRDVFANLIQLHSYNHQLVSDLSRVVQFMCTLQPPEFVFVSFALELDQFVISKMKQHGLFRRHLSDAYYGNIFDSSESYNNGNNNQTGSSSSKNEEKKKKSLSDDLEFVSSFVKQMSHVLLHSNEAKDLRDVLLNCVGGYDKDNRNNQSRDNRRRHLFHIILHSFAHNLPATLSLCLWAGAYRTASTILYNIDPLDVNLVFFLQIDNVIEVLERPLFRHLHLHMLQCDKDPKAEGSGAMLFRTLKLLLMLIPQSSCYSILRDRLVTVSRFRQSAIGPMVPTTNATVSKALVVPEMLEQVDKVLDLASKIYCTSNLSEEEEVGGEIYDEVFVERISQVRALHCEAMWRTIRAESLEQPTTVNKENRQNEGSDRRSWLGYATEEEEAEGKRRFREEKRSRQSSSFSIEEINNTYRDLNTIERDNNITSITNDTTDVVKPKSSYGRQPSDEQGMIKVKNVNESQLEEDVTKDDPEYWKDYWTK